MAQEARQSIDRHLHVQGLATHLIADLPSFSDIRPYIERIDAVRWYSNFGQLVLELEHKLTQLLTAADRTPAHGAIALTTMSTCYHALEVGLQMLGIKEGDKVLIPAVTFPACPLSVRHLGAEPILADVDPDLWVLTPSTARQAALAMKLAAVMPVAVYGIPLPAAEWDTFSRETGIPVIIDAAAAIESQQIPRHGLVAHSLHATKPFGVGEGGLLVGRDADVIQRARNYSNFGTVDRIAHSDGSNTKMSEYHAAVGLAQLTRWADIKKKRRALLILYCKHLLPFDEQISLHPGMDSTVASLLMLRSAKPLPADIIARAKEDGLALHRTYLPPLYRHPYFAGLQTIGTDGKILKTTDAKQKAAQMTHSEMMLKHVIGVPFHPFLDEDDIGRASAILRLIIDI